MAQANADTWLTFGADYRDETASTASTPLEQAYPLVFRCSDAAAAITGITLVTDAGYFASGVSGAFQRPTTPWASSAAPSEAPPCCDPSPS